MGLSHAVAWLRRPVWRRWGRRPHPLLRRPLTPQLQARMRHDPARGVAPALQDHLRVDLSRSSKALDLLRACNAGPSTWTTVCGLGGSRSAWMTGAARSQTPGGQPRGQQAYDLRVPVPPIVALGEVAAQVVELAHAAGDRATAAVAGGLEDHLPAGRTVIAAQREHAAAGVVYQVGPRHRPGRRVRPGQGRQHVAAVLRRIGRQLGADDRGAGRRQIGQAHQASLTRPAAMARGQRAMNGSRRPPS